MIRTAVSRDREGAVYVFAARGHAEKDGETDAAVCAAVSALAGAAARTVAAEWEKGGLLCAPVLDLREGAATVVCTPRPEARERLGAVFAVLKNGLALIKQAAPDLIRVGSNG